nr:uroporphyrinogen-III synthase [Nanchangia anserum]
MSRRAIVRGAAVTEQVPLDGQPAGALAAIATADWVCVTSPSAARLICSATSPIPDGVRVGAVGEATARVLRDHGLRVDLVAGGSGRDLVAAFPPPTRPGRRVVLPASRRASSTVPDGLTQLGWSVDRVDLYDTRPLPRIPEVFAAADVVAATAGSAVRALAEAGLWHREGPRLVTIGRPSWRVARDLGIPSVAHAPTPTPEGFAAALAPFCPLV